MRRRAFTVLETLIVTAIVVILTGLMLPALQAAKHRSQVTGSVSQLRQMHIAIMLYQSDYGGGNGGYGSLAAAGLPSIYDIIRGNPPVVPKSIWKSPCGWNPAEYPSPASFQYLYWLEDGAPPFLIALSKYEEQMMLFSDFNCADHDRSMDSPYITHRCLGVALDGSLKDLKKRGDPHRVEWWIEHE